MESQSESHDESDECNIEHTGYAPREDVEKWLSSKTGDRCWKCKFFDPFEGVTSDVITMGDFVSVTCALDGSCRRNAPALNVVVFDDEHAAIWPWVRWDDWCGEFVECNRTIDDLTGPAAN